jgi:hypothetical protein
MQRVLSCFCRKIGIEHSRPFFVSSHGGFVVQQEISLSFEGVSALVVKYLSPVEQLSPFKVGQIQKLIADIAESAG